MSFEDFKKRYTQNKKLGEGAYGRVYKGIDNETKSDIAIKEIDLSVDYDNKDLEKQKDVERKQKHIIHEIEIMKLLNNLTKTCFSYLIEVYDIVHNDYNRHFMYIVMDLYSKSLENIYTELSRDFKQFTIYFKDVINCLKIMHENNIYHRDIKPANIMIDSDKNIKIIDFNLSIILKDDNIPLTICGTPHYISRKLVYATLENITDFQEKRKILKIQDYWSTLCTFYLLFTRDYLTMGRDWKTEYQNLVNNQYSYNGKNIFRLPFLDLLNECLTYVKSDEYDKFINAIDNFK